jgi:hypothetical protein
MNTNAELSCFKEHVTLRVLVLHLMIDIQATAFFFVHTKLISSDLTFLQNVSYRREERLFALQYQRLKTSELFCVKFHNVSHCLLFLHSFTPATSTNENDVTETPCYVRKTLIW